MKFFVILMLCLNSLVAFAEPVANVSLAKEQTILAVMSAPKIYSETTHEDNKEHKYRIMATYPQINAENQAQYVKFNECIKRIIDKITKNFLKNLSENPKSTNTTDQPSTLTIKYTISNFNNHYISVRFNVDNYIQGNPYPNDNYHVVNYDLRTKSFIALKDIFTPHSNFLAFLDEHCLKRLAHKTQMDTNQLKLHFLNYEDWNIQPTGILFTFDNFPHVIGTQTVLVRYNLLTNYLLPSFLKEVEENNTHTNKTI